MLLAAEERKGFPPTFQAVALEFDARHDFRSRCLVLWGPVRKFADVPGDGESRVSATTAIMEAAGVHNVMTKSLGSSNPHNVVRATFEGLKELMDPYTVLTNRGLDQVEA